MLGLVVSVAARSARAETEGQTRVAVRVQAERECVDTSGFWRALAARTDKLDRVGSVEGDAASARGNDATIDVRVRRSRGRVIGELRVERGGHKSESRALTGASCEEITRGLSLVAALAFDPGARIDVPELPATSPASAPPATSAASAPPATSPAPPPSAAPAAAAREVSPASPARERAQAAPPSGAYRLAVGGGASAIALGAQETSAGYGGFVELARDRSGLSPAFRVGLTRATGDARAETASAGPVTADLGWWLARSSACPVRLDFASSLHFRPCAGLDVGAMTGTPRAPIQGSARTRAWLAPTLSARINWELYRIAFLEVAGDLALPLVRDELAADPSVSLYRAPVVVPSGSLAAGVRFP